MLMYHKMSLNPSSIPAFTFRCGVTANKSVDAINLLTAGRPVQPSAKLLDNWFNGNSTNVNICPRPKDMMATTSEHTARLFR